MTEIGKPYRRIEIVPKRIPVPAPIEEPVEDDPEEDPTPAVPVPEPEKVPT